MRKYIAYKKDSNFQALLNTYSYLLNYKFTNMNQKQQHVLSLLQNQSSILKTISLIFLISVVGLFPVFICYRVLICQNSMPGITSKIQPTVYYALIGDIGGTNIRYQLISFNEKLNNPLEIIKEQRLKVIEFSTFQNTITHFLSDISQSIYPSLAVIAMAGPVQDNSVTMPNIPKWGYLNGNKLSSLFDFSKFLIINDFEAASYGLLIIQDTEFIKLNKINPDPSKIRGIIGPGTGLGHSILFSNELVEDGISVLPSEAGHSDVPFIDQQTLEYVNFLKRKMGSPIDLQKTFSGPSIPMMYEFYFSKIHPNLTFIPKESLEIVQQCVKQHPDEVHQKVFELFMKFYCSAIANFMIQHMTTGGVYLIGGLTKAFIGKLQNKDILEDWKERHPQMVKIVQKIPLIFCNEIDLGLKGSFYIAKRTVKRMNQQGLNDKQNRSNRQETL